MTVAQTKKEAATGRRMMRPEAAAAYIGVSPSTLAKMRLRGTGPAYSKLSPKLVLYDPDVCDAYLVERRRLSTSEL